MNELHTVDRIGVDFDNVLCDLHSLVCTQIREKYNIDYYPDDIDRWDAELPNGKPLSKEISPLIKSEDALVRTEMIDGAQEGMSELIEHGYSVAIVTHRPETIHAPIREWLAEREIPYHDFVTDVPHNKGLVDIDLLIDDRPLNVSNVIDEGKHGIHFSGGWDGSENIAYEFDGKMNGTGADCTSRPMLRRAESWTDVSDLLTERRKRDASDER